MSVARIHVVKKARKDQGHCNGCKHPIRKGDAYRWYTIGFRSRYKHTYCTDCELPPPSARESNDKVAALLAAREEFDDAITKAGDRDAIVSALNDYVSGVQEAAELWEEAASAIEDGFQHETEMSERLRANGDAAQGAADEVDSTACEIESEEREERETEDEFIERLRDMARAAVDDNEVEYE